MSLTRIRHSHLAFGQTELIHTIRRCGLTSGLQLCLDTGDALSYTSGQSWLDRSGNGYDFFLGMTGSVEESDPTFNGTAGRRSSGEYFSYNGSQGHRYDSANETWMNNIHKDNAKFTLLTWVYLPNLTTSNGLIGTSGGTDVVGFHWFLLSTEQLQIAVWNGGGNVLDSTDTTAGTIGAWNFCAISLDEAVGAGGGLHFMNGTVSTFTSTYTSPSAAAAAYTTEICALGNASFPVENTLRMGMFAAWNVALTQTQLSALYQGTRGRFGA